MSRNPEFVSAATIHKLARFRYQLRRFLRFSEKAARQGGLTPQQHQLLLGIAGHTGRGWATISELSEFLQERHNAVVGLVERAHRAGLVSKEPVARDRRLVCVQLTPRGRKILNALSVLHRRELGRFQVLSELLFRQAAMPNGLAKQAKAEGQAARHPRGRAR